MCILAGMEARGLYLHNTVNQQVHVMVHKAKPELNLSENSGSNAKLFHYCQESSTVHIYWSVAIKITVFRSDSRGSDYSSCLLVSRL